MISSMNGLMFLLSLQLIQQGVEALEAALPKPAVALQPCAGVCERLAFDPGRSALRVTAARDQPGALQHLQVLGH